ncbi:uncharacterized protein [Amphiura filiformis]|uniref:uncharacterized protein n=1 Tax=Amphiura filiformis TaxID=82378 RepID=UPI003B21E090
MASKLLLLTLLLFGPSICLAKKSRYGKWGYKAGPDGPGNWGRIKGGQSCLGTNQSPIDVNTAETVEQNFTPFVLRNYDSDGRAGNPRPVEMSNNGKTIKINLEGDYMMRGGGLPNLYKAVQMHFHWGADWTKGSEHTVNGRSFPAELHIVHYDTVRFTKFYDALTKPEGLAVLGFFLKVGKHNTAWDTIINHLSNVRYVTNKYDYRPEPFRLDSLLPMTHLDKFYRYRGSLTTPGCYESVIWTVFDYPVELSKAQLAKFRTLTKLHAPPSQVRERLGGGAEREEDLILDNFRPVQRSNYRNVYQSFEHQEQQRPGTGAGGGAGGGAGAGAGGGAGGRAGGGAGGRAGGGAGGRAGAGGGAGAGGRVGGGAGTGAGTGARAGAGAGTGAGTGANYPNYAGGANYPNYGGTGAGGANYPNYGGTGAGGANYPNYGGAGGRGANYPNYGGAGGDSDHYSEGIAGGDSDHLQWNTFDAYDFYGDPSLQIPDSSGESETSGGKTGTNGVSGAVVVNNAGNGAAVAPKDPYGGYDDYGYNGYGTGNNGAAVAPKTPKDPYGDPYGTGTNAGYGGIGGNTGYNGYGVDTGNDPYGAGTGDDPYGAGTGDDPYGAGTGDDPYGVGTGDDPYGAGTGGTAPVPVMTLTAPVPVMASMPVMVVTPVLKQP